MSIVDSKERVDSLLAKLEEVETELAKYLAMITNDSFEEVPQLNSAKMRIKDCQQMIACSTLLNKETIEAIIGKINDADSDMTEYLVDNTEEVFEEIPDVDDARLLLSECYEFLG